MAQKRLEMELDVEAMIHEHKANMLRQDMMRRQAELNALEAQRRHREEQKLKELEVGCAAECAECAEWVKGRFTHQRSVGRVTTLHLHYITFTEAATMWSLEFHSGDKSYYFSVSHKPQRQQNDSYRLQPLSAQGTKIHCSGCEPDNMFNQKPDFDIETCDLTQSNN